MPKAYANYRSYKPFLRLEFERRCVYCRIADSLRGQESFGADHYRPKVIFPELSTDYSNLFYCCNQCNSRKSNFWPAKGEADSKFIPNPCDYRMIDHLKFVDGVVQSKSEAGKFSIDQLDLNDPKIISYRLNILHLIEVQEGQLEASIKTEREIRAAFDTKKLSQVDRDVYLNTIIADRKKIDNALAYLRGE